MIIPSTQAIEKLRDMLTEKCTNIGLGFRLSYKEETGERYFKLRLDSQQSEDEIIFIGGVKIFVNPKDTILLDDYKLDYRLKPGMNGGDFVLVLSNHK